MTTIDVCKVLRDDHAELAILRDRANDYIKRGKRFEVNVSRDGDWYITYRFYNDDVIDDIDDLK